jgi:hypothetical protein
MPFDPRKRFAIVVAIEKYEKLPSDWNRIRTIGDGINFVRWLCENEKLPAENIRFFVEERDGINQGALDDLKRDHGVAHEGAKVELIRSALTEWLVERLAETPEGDCAFYFYWSGHGVSNSRVKHGLVCSEMKPGTNPRVFSLEAVRATLCLEGWKRLRHQAFFVDACASPYPRGRELLPVDLPSDANLVAPQPPRQFIACAAPPGATVSNNGRFFSILLDVLRESRREDAMPDMDYVAALLWHRYKLLRRGGQLASDPWPYLDLVPWNGASIPLAIIEDEGEDARLRRWKREAVALVANLHPHGISTPFDHYVKCEGRSEDPDISIPAMAEDLGELLDRRGVPRILEWLVCIGTELEDEHEINRWLNDTFVKDLLGLQRLNDLRQRLKPPQPPFYLFVEIPDARACYVRCRVFDSEGRRCYEPVVTDEIEPAAGAIKELLRNILEEQAMTRYLTDLHIELLLPKQLLHFEADRWPDPHDPDRLLGDNYRVALRWIDRAERYTHHTQRWIELAEAICAVSCKPIGWTEPDADTKDFNFHLMKKRPCFFTGFAFHPFSEPAREKAISPLLDKALDLGAPFALWVRERGKDWDKVRNRIEQALCQHGCHPTPDDVRELRLADDPLLPRGLGVLWDDPNRNPFRYDPNTDLIFRGRQATFINVAG